MSVKSRVTFIYGSDETLYACPAVGMALTMLLKLFPETPLRNALTAGWISIGNLWMFGGLLATMKKAKEK